MNDKAQLAGEIHKPALYNPGGAAPIYNDI